MPWLKEFVAGLGDGSVRVAGDDGRNRIAA